METRASNIAVGAFVLALVVGAIGFVFWVGKYSERVATVDHYVRFAGSVAGLDVGSNVLFGGIPIGHVTSVIVDPLETSLARVDIAVDAKVPIRVDSKAVLAMQGITGGVLVEISRGTVTSALLKPGVEIQSGYSPFERLLNGAPELIAKGNDLMDRAARFLSPDNAAAVGRVLLSIDRLTEALAADSVKFDTLLSQGAEAVKQVSATGAEFEKLAADLRGTTGKVGAQANDTLAQIRVLSENFSKTSQRLTQLIDDNRQPVRDFTGTGLYELTQMITEVRLLAQTMNRISIQIERDPARFFFGDRQKGFTAQ
jgi:phospholipid/cholesterol/gamma-HCH transport system substrate-binding protein